MGNYGTNYTKAIQMGGPQSTVSVKKLEIIRKHKRNILVNHFMKENKIIKVKAFTERKDVSFTTFPEVTAE